MKSPPAASEALRNQCDADIQDILADAARSASVILAAHAAEVKELAELLMKKGTVEQPEIDGFFRRQPPLAPPPTEPPSGFANRRTGC